LDEIKYDAHKEGLDLRVFAVKQTQRNSHTHILVDRQFRDNATRKITTKLPEYPSTGVKNGKLRKFELKPRQASKPSLEK
jgi:hypothetical protein